jgi:hypothetical protein
MKSKGKLKVSIIKANFKKDFDIIGRMDPYVTLRLGCQQFKTDTAYGMGKHPTWSNLFEFTIHDEERIEMFVYDKDMIYDDFVASGVIPIHSVFASLKEQKWVPVDSKGSHGGEILVGLEFIPSIHQNITGMMVPKIVANWQHISKNNHATIPCSPQNPYQYPNLINNQNMYQDIAIGQDQVNFQFPGGVSNQFSDIPLGNLYGQPQAQAPILNGIHQNFENGINYNNQAINSPCQQPQFQGLPSQNFQSPGPQFLAPQTFTDYPKITESQDIPPRQPENHWPGTFTNNFPFGPTP